MFISKIINVNTKNNLQNSKNGQCQTYSNVPFQLNHDEVSFKSKVKIEQLLIEEMFKKPIPLKGNTPEEKVNDLIGIILKNKKTAGSNFKKAMNSVLTYLAQKGVLIEVHPCNGVFESEIIIKKNATSHLAKTLQDSNCVGFLARPRQTFSNKNSARVCSLERIRNHLIFYKPSLFNENLAACNAEMNFEQYLPKVPEKIQTQMDRISGIPMCFREDIEKIDGATDNLNDLYQKGLETLMPENGILDNATLSKIKPVKDDYIPVYPKPFDWKAYQEMFEKPFTI